VRAAGIAAVALRCRGRAKHRLQDLSGEGKSLWTVVFAA